MYKGELSAAQPVKVTATNRGAGNAGITLTWIGNGAPPPEIQFVEPTGAAQEVFNEPAKRYGLQVDIHPPAGGGLQVAVTQGSAAFSDVIATDAVWVFFVQ